MVASCIYGADGFFDKNSIETSEGKAERKTRRRPEKHP
jgi:hypothetical protein